MLPHLHLRIFISGFLHCTVCIPSIYISSPHFNKNSRTNHESGKKQDGQQSTGPLKYCHQLTGPVSAPYPKGKYTSCHYSHGYNDSYMSRNPCFLMRHAIIRTFLVHFRTLMCTAVTKHAPVYFTTIYSRTVCNHPASLCRHIPVPYAVFLIRFPLPLKPSYPVCLAIQSGLG